MKTEFENYGYSKDYSIEGKYIGSEKVNESDRDKLGYEGRKTEILTEDKRFRNKKYPKGTKVTTELQQICGNIKTKL